MTGIDVRRAFGLQLVLAALLYCAQYLIGVGYEITTGPYDVYVSFENGRLFSYLVWLAPALAALPFATSFSADWKSRSITAQWLRAGRRTYTRSKLIGAALTGGLACAGGLILFYLALLPGGHTDYYEAAFESVGGMMEVLLNGQPVQYLAGLAVLKWLEGAYYGAAALAFSAFCPNVYLVLCFPIFMHRLTSALMRWWQAPRWMNLAMLGNGEIGLALWPTLGVGAAVFLPLIVLGSAVFALGVRRRLEHG
ncbi:MAG: hypothetical protein VB067_13995 [Christensenellaceae bacterium]|nr:hypothetical protein [Christensenellaceae bacterium]MEA5066621.1 hypothetical protein [Eubacteriales bacterium]MEA5070103.1 hypothetical protein [Christensenellaceae bacterium]